MVFKRGLLLILVLALAAAGVAQTDAISKIQADFYAWDMVLQTYAVDFMAFPKGDSLSALAAYMKIQRYWVEPILYDPWGNLYRYSSDGKSYTLTSAGPDGRFGTADDLRSGGAVAEPLPPPEEKPTKPPLSSYSVPGSRSTDASLMLAKSTNDIIFSWSGAGPTYDVTGATDPRFLNSYLLQKDQASSPYTYNGALGNPKSVEFFDVTEPTETNHAQDANGLFPPTPPALSSTSGTWYIGGSVTIAGTTFSEVPADNLVCFSGGYCIHPDDTSTTTQLSLKVPPGAISGSISNGIGLLESNRLSQDISLEDPLLPTMTIRTLGSVKASGDYYSGVSETTFKVIRHTYNAGTGKWTRGEVSLFQPDNYYCSTDTDRFGTIYCGDATGSISLSVSTRIPSSAPLVMSSCKAVGVPGSMRTVKACGAAPDPNPEGVAGRDVVYIPFDDALNGRYIYKIPVDAGGCQNSTDSDYGNRGGAWYWNALVGLAVDPKTGDLYVGERLTTTTACVKVIRNDGNETLEVFKTGFNNIFGLAVWREPGSNFGFLLVADTSGGQVKAVPLDNPSASIVTVATASSPRGICTGLTTYDTSTYQASDLIRLLVAHNDGGAIKLRKPPFFTTDPSEGMPVNIWISSPEPTDKPTYQGLLHSSIGTDFINSTVKMKASFSDGVARTVCVAAGDAQSSAPYETQFVPNWDCCKRPMYDPLSSDPGNPTEGCTSSVSCDNAEGFVPGYVGSPTSPTANNPFLSCSTCGSSTSPCTFEFKITKTRSGDNYRYYFMPNQSRTVLSSFTATAFKRALIKQDQMCQYGGLLFENFDCQNCAPNCDKIKVYSWTNVGFDPIVVFDESNSFATGGETRTITGITVNGDGSTTLTLDSALTKSYFATLNDGASPPNPTFSNGHSAGFCVPNSGFYTADSSQLNRRDKTGPFDDAFVQFMAPNAETGVVPYLPSIDLSTDQTKIRALHFHQIWFPYKRPLSCMVGTTSCTDCCNSSQNHFHLMGINQKEVGSWGDTIASSDITWSYILYIQNNCPGCSVADILRAIQQNCCHECGHQYGVNCGTEMHDDNWVWCGACGAALTQTCVMSIGQGIDDRKDGVNRFCCFNLMQDNNKCSLDGTKCGNGIRRTDDPQ